MHSSDSYPDIYQYFDFRSYLRDYVAAVRKEDPSFSYQLFADRYKLKSRAHLNDVIQGRPLTEKFLPAYLKFCNLSGGRAAYFKALVGYRQAKSDAQREACFQEILRRSPSIQSVRLEEEAYRYFEHWYHPALISLVDIYKHEQDHRVLARLFKPRISAVKARRAVETLTELGFISWNETQERWIIHNKFFHCTSGGQKAAIKRFHRQVVDLGVRALTDDYERQQLSTLTVSARRETRREIKKILGEARKKILDLVRSEDDPAMVYQVNLQLFELSEPPKRTWKKKADES